MAASAALALAGQGQPPTGAAQDRRVRATRSVMKISGAPGLPPKYAVPDFIALTNDAETVAAAKTIGQVLWDDLNFEREFYLIPRDTYRTIPPATSIDQVPLDQWKQLGADGLIIGTVRKTGDRGRRPGAADRCRHRADRAGKEYSGTLKNPRLYAHTASDEIHQQQRALARRRADQARIHVRP